MGVGGGVEEIDTINGENWKCGRRVLEILKLEIENRSSGHWKCERFEFEMRTEENGTTRGGSATTLKYSFDWFFTKTAPRMDLYIDLLVWLASYYLPLISGLAIFGLSMALISR